MKVIEHIKEYFLDTRGMMDICNVIASFAALLCVTVVIVAGFCFLSFQHKGLFYECQKKHLPRVGRCTKNEQLFISEELREKVYLCVMGQLSKELTEEQKSHMDKYKICFRAAGKKCLDKKSKH
ncbi:hypothetical protein TNIN_53371 [Trichonephila inaurata madagascariensis]|uniref:Uncharacterized protein n=1 Tax=Trichonephila inaurata madagascariensis TaxID=2747483 RepID=A0A8X6Y2F2_9ARAC|nr:hypothetical protein TNIN_53371 [Trichonephila inaurata madagascariensis]